MHNENFFYKIKYRVNLMYSQRSLSILQHAALKKWGKIGVEKGKIECEKYEFNKYCK